MNKRTSLKDIAGVVGVSVTLVSYVLNNKKENRINKAVAQKIREVAKALNYQPNQIAKSLKTNRTRTLGLIVADIADPFSASLARIIEDEADRQQYTVLFGSSDEKVQKGQKLIDTFLNRQVDGLLIAAADGMEPQIADLQQRGIPFVLIDRYFPQLRTSYVALNNYQSTHTAVQHLIDRGYQRIGMITLNSPLFHMRERTRGYQAALNDNSIPFQKRWLKEVSIDNLTGEVTRAFRELRAGQQPVDAIVFASNSLSLLGLKQIKLLGIRVPQELAVVGFDETEAYDLFYAPLTYVRQPLQAMGQLATKILLETLTTPGQITQANLDASLVVQASTRPEPLPLFDLPA